ncbi:hypothetical protein E3P99_03284 [Wallemia hederae]|uniref:Uncharacterized protein n=1 Tax=Wallemia hederae TaxID=1540922 RepID=A0A4V4LSP5_9BASI|nr:hypothetical protein E3P99_03284 [Wallemia hederae]
MDAPAARRTASGRAQLLSGLRRPSQLEQHEFILQQQQATIDQLASLQAQTEQIFAQMNLSGGGSGGVGGGVGGYNNGYSNGYSNGYTNSNREAASSNMHNMTTSRRLSSNPPSTNSYNANHANHSFKGRRPASLNLSAVNTSTPILEEKGALSAQPQLPHTASLNNAPSHRNTNTANKRKTYSNLGHLPPVPQSAPANGRNASFRIPSALGSANSLPQCCVRQPRGPPSENLEAVNFSSRQRKLASRRLSGLANIAEARRRVSVVPNDDSIDASNGD